MVWHSAAPAGLSRVPSVLQKAAAHLLLPSPPAVLPGAGLEAGGSGQQTGEGRTDLCQQRGWPALLVVCRRSPQGTWSAVECLVLPGSVFVFVVMAWGWLVEFFCCLFFPPFIISFSSSASVL